MLTIRATATYARWERKLKDPRARAVIANRIARLAHGLTGDAKSVGGNVSELRIHYGPGYRVYFTHRGNEVIILLCGGDKSSQERDIERARKLVRELEE